MCNLSTLGYQSAIASILKETAGHPVVPPNMVIPGLVAMLLCLQETEEQMHLEILEREVHIFNCFGVH